MPNALMLDILSEYGECRCGYWIWGIVLRHYLEGHWKLIMGFITVLIVPLKGLMGVTPIVIQVGL